MVLLQYTLVLEGQCAGGGRRLGVFLLEGVGQVGELLLQVLSGDFELFGELFILPFYDLSVFAFEFLELLCVFPVV